MKEIETQEKENFPQDIPPFPEHCIQGVAREFATLYNEYIECPHSFLSMSFLTFLGAKICRLISLEGQLDTQPRLYTIIVGRSADDRKSESINQTIKFFKYVEKHCSDEYELKVKKLEKIRKLMDHKPERVDGKINASDIIINISKPLEKITLNECDMLIDLCHGVGSAEGLAKVLKKYPLLLVFDEFRSFVSKAKIEGSILMQIVASLFGKNIFQSAVKKFSIDLKDAHLSIIGACTKDTYMSMWTKEFTDIGLINRLFVVVDSSERRESIPRNIPPEKLKPVCESVSDIFSFVEKLSGSGPYKMKITEDARALFDVWYLNPLRPKDEHERRLDDYARRLFLLFAINEKKDIIDIDIVSRVLEIMDWERNARRLVAPNSSETLMGRVQENIRRVLNRRYETSIKANLRKGETLTKKYMSKRELEKLANKTKMDTGIWDAAMNGLMKDKQIAEVLQSGKKFYEIFSE